MTTTKPPENMFSSSTLRNFTMCPRYSQLRDDLGLVPHDISPSPKTEFGTAFHLAVELLDKGASQTEAILKSTDYFRPYEPAPSISAAGNEIESLYTCVRLAKIIVEWMEYWKDDPITVWQGLSEEGFAEELIPGIYYCGRIDRIIEERLGIRPSDLKTTKTLSSYIYCPHDQAQGYQWLAKKFFGSKITGFLFDMIGLTKAKRIFHREPITYTDFQINEWVEGRKRIVDNIFHCRKTGFWPKYSQKCNDYFSPCQYIPVCNATSDVGYERILKCYDVDYWFSYNIEGVEK